MINKFIGRSLTLLIFAIVWFTTSRTWEWCHCVGEPLSVMPLLSIFSVQCLIC